MTAWIEKRREEGGEAITLASSWLPAQYLPTPPSAPPLPSLSPASTHAVGIHVYDDILHLIKLYLKE